MKRSWSTRSDDLTNHEKLVADEVRDLTNHETFMADEVQ